MTVQSVELHNHILGILFSVAHVNVPVRVRRPVVQDKLSCRGDWRTFFINADFRPKREYLRSRFGKWARIEMKFVNEWSLNNHVQV